MFLQKWYEPIFLRPACYLDLNLRKIKRWSDACWSRPRLLQLFTKQFSLFLSIMSIDSLLRQIIIILLRFWLEISVNMQWIYDMPRICSEFAQNLLRICWESAENLLRIYSEFAENLIRNCWESAHNLQRICTNFAENLLRICWESAHCLLSICWDSAEN